MSPGLIIYSPNEIRGKIILKTLEVNGIDSSFFVDHFEAHKSALEHLSPIIILDLKDDPASEINLFKSAVSKLPESTFIVLTDRSDSDTVKELNLSNLHVHDILDPESILTQVKSALSNVKRNKSNKSVAHFKKHKAKPSLEQSIISSTVIKDNRFFLNQPQPAQIENTNCDITSEQHEDVGVEKKSDVLSANSFQRKIPEFFPAKLYSKLRATSVFFLKSIPIFATLFIGIIGGYIYWCISDIPAVENLKNISPYNASQIYSYDNNLLSEFYVQRRTLIPFEKIPKHVINAFIAVEDTRFFKHSGIDPFRIIGALVANIKEGGYLQGGSTITQQLAKMIFLSPKKSISRKIQEAALSLQIERKYTKDEILERYFNQAYFGTRAYGIEAASHVYFGKTIDQISLSDSALLAALPKAPSVYSPFKDPKKSVNRRNYVLKRMLDTGFINEKEYNEALKDHLPKNFHGRKYKAPYFVDYCRATLEKNYGSRLYTSGLKIYTTLDYRLQQIAENAVQNGMESLRKRGVSKAQAALLAIDIDTGRIKAMVGGTNFWDSQFNRVTQAKRQPGSAFKPFVYLTALNQGFTVNDTIQDIELTYFDDDPECDGTWTPHNYDEVYHGPVTLKKAMASSLNAATVNLANLVRIKNVIQTAKNLGITSKINPVYSSALGASETSLIELVYAYAAFSHGNRVQPVCIDKIIDREQSALWEPSGKKEKVIDDMALANIRKLLRSVILEGTGIKASKLNKTVYGKTGTTNNYADALFIGFDDNIALGVWVGNDNHSSLGDKITGASAALPIWIEFMKNAYI